MVGKTMMPRSDKEISRRLAISNIAWAREPFESYLDLIRSEGASGVELAASLIWDEQVDSTPEERRRLRRVVEDHDLEITGLHSLLFSRPELQLLSNGQGGVEVRDYLKRLADLCADLGGRYLVLGGSKNRLRGSLSKEEAMARATDALREVGEHAAPRHCFFVLEALPPPVCDFLMSLDECAELCDIAESEAVQYQFDTGAAEMTEAQTSDESLIAHLREIRHCQVNDFELLAPGSKNPNAHSHWSRLLDAAGYSGWIGIEMRKPAESDPSDGIRRAIRFVREKYNSIEV
jgi:sugar phosphate isomerase/epimerase